MTTTNLGSSTINKIYFGIKQAKYGFLGSTLVFIKDVILYTAKASNTSITDTIESGNAGTTPTDIFEAPGATV